MSDSTMLTEPARLLQIEPAQISNVLECATAAELAVVRIDLAGCTDKPTALRRIADALRFPAWFGHNWDALADCLGDLSWFPAPGYLLLFEHGEAWRDANDPELATLLEILDQAAQTWAERDVPFWPVMVLQP